MGHRYQNIRCHTQEPVVLLGNDLKMDIFLSLHQQLDRQVTVALLLQA